jgi:hypothetical protein
MERAPQSRDCPPHMSTLHDVRMRPPLRVVVRARTSLRYLSGYKGASLGMTWLESGVVETVDVEVRAWGPRP